MIIKFDKIISCHKSTIIYDT